MKLNSMEEVMEMVINDPDLKEILHDPVAFSRAVLDIEPRWYQKQLLRDVNNGVSDIIARWGRRTGKTFSMILHMVFYAFANEDSKQLVIAPRGVQVNEIFDELRSFIKKHSMLNASVERMVRSPHKIEFGNGSRIMGLSAGSSTGGSAENVRGQGADIIYLDETDYLNDEDLNAILGVSLGDLDSTKIWCASTPTGARELFFDWCQNCKIKYEIDRDEDDTSNDYTVVKTDRSHLENSGWHQYHYPSYVHPKWDKKMESELKAKFSKQGYIHEVLAKFGDETEGVFNKEKINDSKVGYTYGDMKTRKPMPQNLRVIGVDWDKYAAATQIIVSEYMPNEGNNKDPKIRIVDRVEIPSTEFTFDNAVNRIQELYKEWQPQKIYVDRGYGEYQVETLKKELGKEVVTGIAFNEKLEVRDPTDNSVDKKTAKHFMVNQSTILLERDQLEFSEYDRKFIKQIMNYRVVRRTKNKKPVYTSENEHALDAFMLTVLCLTTEFPGVAKILEKKRHAKTIGTIDKRLVGVEDKVFEGKFNDLHSTTDDDLNDEPDYVRYMKEIEEATKKSTHSRSSWGSRGRGRKKKPPGRSSGRSSF